jgi:hypothetical protein
MLMLSVFARASPYGSACWQPAMFSGAVLGAVLVLHGSPPLGLATAMAVLFIMVDDSIGESGSSIDIRHLLLVGAGPGLGLAVAGRFAEGGYRVALVDHSTNGLGALGESPADTGTQLDPPY